MLLIGKNVYINTDRGYSYVDTNFLPTLLLRILFSSSADYSKSKISLSLTSKNQKLNFDCENGHN